MKSKRGSNKIYYYIDLFFILLPLFIYIGGFIIYLFNNNNGTNGNLTIPQITNFFELYLDQVSNLISKNFLDVNYTNGLVGIIFNIIDPILDWFGINSFNGDAFGIYLLEYYFMWVIIYEFFSLFINIIMWLPRWARNKVRDWNGSDSV